MIEMSEAFLGGFLQVFTVTTFSLMLVGVGIGFIVGILPGLGGPVTLALMLPFIFRMDAVQAFAFLLGMAAVTATTGDITSVLFGIPGEGITAATIVDGHPMAKKGEAGRALGAALMSSLVGAIFGAFALALAIPIVRPLVLSIGSPEFFMLALLGVTFIASLSGNGTGAAKGLTAAAIGFMLATVGRDPISSIKRYTFGSLYLWDGLGLVPVTLGLFAIPEIIDLAVKETAIAETQVGKLGGVMQGVKDTFRHWWLVFRCSAIGAYIGVIPGMGGSVSQWVAYAHAVQSSPNKERFGKGAVEGVLGPGAANNSNLGGGLVPTIAFGVPGNVTMAILLGAFTIQGLVPGPSMLIPESQGGHLTLTFSFIWIIVVSNIITVAACFLFIRQLARITEVRGGLVIPFILLMVYLGAFAEKNTFDDLIVVLAFGTLGWAMVVLDWPRPPLLLGLVLGPLAENNLFLATDNYGLTWLWQPSVLFLGLVILVGTFYPLVQKWWKQADEPTTEKTTNTVLGSGWEVLFTFFIVVLFGWCLWTAQHWAFRARFFPWVIGFPGLALASLQLVLSFRQFSKREVDRRLPKTDAQASLVFYRTTIILGWILGFFSGIWLLGFLIASPVCTFLYLKITAREKWLITSILTGFSWFSFFLFSHYLRLPFPEGVLISWLMG